MSTYHNQEYIERRSKDEMDDDLTALVESVQDLLEKWSDTEKRLRNLANKLEVHMLEPDAHNPGMLRRK